MMIMEPKLKINQTMHVEKVSSRQLKNKLKTNSIRITINLFVPSVVWFLRGRYTMIRDFFEILGIADP